MQAMSPNADPGPTAFSGERRRTAAAACLVLLLAVTMRGVILFTGQKHLRSDEAVVGLMAKHIVTRGERPLFLYGQPYGGGHAIAAYIAAPLFAVFGRSAILLTGITAAVSVVNIVLLWLILRRYFDEWIAAAGAGIYAFSPPVVYQSFLVNGGTESFCLALLALVFFLRAYLDGRRPLRSAALAGLFCGMAYYAMDYALLYAIVFVLLWAATGRAEKWSCLGLFGAGFLVGCMPLIVYNLTHDFAHLRYMLEGGVSGSDVGFIRHFTGALWDAIAGDLAAFFTGDIDDFNREAVGVGSWIQAGVGMAAVVGLLYEWRHATVRAIKKISLRGTESSSLPAVMIPVVFIVIYMAIYCVARFSLQPGRTPRYFLPLCPFVSVVIALFLLWKRILSFAGR